MTRRRARPWLLAAATLLLLGGSVVVAGPGTAADVPYCGLGGFAPEHRFVWVGGHGNAWETAANWNRGTVPGTGDSDTLAADYVCIGGAADVHVTEADKLSVAALDLGQRAGLTIDRGGKLFLNGDQATQPSVVRPASRLWLYASTVGGSGDLRVGGTLRWTTTSEGAATQTTSQCDVLHVGTCPARTPGRTTVLAGGLMTVDGTPGGVNLVGRRTIDNAGTVTLVNEGYVAADRGTTILNEAGGVFQIANNRGVYEGFPIAGRPAPVLRNDGTLSKTRGAGSAVVGARFVAGTGTVSVLAGTLSIAGDVVPTARVTAGATYGTGACEAGDASNPCHVASVAEDANGQLAAVTVPSDLTAPATVGLAEQAATGAPAGALGLATRIGLQQAVSPSDQPVTLRFSLSTSLLGGRDPRTLRAYRSPSADAAFTLVPRCAAGGALPAGAASCQSGAAALPGGGGIVTVRSLPKLAGPTSRWIVG